MSPSDLDFDLELALLSLLEGRERYGLDLAKTLTEMADGERTITPGTLYPALHRMETRGWLTSTTQPSPRGGHDLRYYRLTQDGQAILNRKRQAHRRWHRALSSLWN